MYFFGPRPKKEHRDIYIYLFGPRPKKEHMIYIYFFGPRPKKEQLISLDVLFKSLDLKRNMHSLDF